MKTLHSAPLGDLIEHDVQASTAECICGPQLKLFVRTGGGYTWLLLHHSLDGRESAQAQ